MFAIMQWRILKKLFIVFLFLMLMSEVQLITGCANIIPPSGGPRDSIPPVLLAATPPDSTVNFRADRIQLTFDEFVDLKDVQNNLLFTPTFDNNPEVSVRNKTVTVKFRDSLQPNTTYIFNFGSAIADFNEGNALRNFTYTFSTGPAIDSLEIKGKVVLAESGKTDSTLIVILHKDLSDSAVANQRPMYVTRLDQNGNFRFRNLPPGRFAIYALGDAGLGRRYQNASQLFAFSDSVAVPGQTTDLTLYAYRQSASATQQAPAGNNPLQRSGTDRRLQYTTNLANSQLDLGTNLQLSANTMFQQFRREEMSLFRDSVYAPVAFQATLDTAQKNITVAADWQPGTSYHLVLNRDFAEDSAGRKLLKNDTLHFVTKQLADYGQLRLRLRNVDLSRNPVLQFVQNEQVKFAAPLTGASLNIDMFTPGEYELHVLFDRNKNGVWDPGNFFGEKRQPEIVKPVGRSINVKPNWENEFDISL